MYANSDTKTLNTKILLIGKGSLASSAINTLYHSYAWSDPSDLVETTGWPRSDAQGGEEQHSRVLDCSFGLGDALPIGEWGVRPHLYATCEETMSSAVLDMLLPGVDGVVHFVDADRLRDDPATLEPLRSAVRRQGWEWEDLPVVFIVANTGGDDRLHDGARMRLAPNRASLDWDGLVQDGADPAWLGLAVLLKELSSRLDAGRLLHMPQL